MVYLMSYTVLAAFTHMRTAKVRHIVRARRERPGASTRRAWSAGICDCELVVTCCNIMIIKLLCTKVYKIVIYIYIKYCIY
jgi:hypothetical protein